ncbi:RNB domain-containing ribonuclease [Kytococcus sedentarius]|uniref:RNB domain-containing ribonuclease n=1 Tax=Kytococcus sedentarius TaxID=1276 RepID=UPI0035BBEE22
MAHPHLTLRPTDRDGSPATETGTAPAAADGLVAAFAAIRDEHEVPGEFPADVLAEAEEVAGAAVLPERDERAVEFITIDPEGSMDLDQAMHIEREGDGFLVRYAIADVPAFVTPDGAIAAESWRRGLTIYCPDERTPLHPPVVSEGAASLLPEEDRPAFLWELHLDAAGALTQASVGRAAVRSRRRYTYVEAQEQIDAGSAEETLLLLKEVGLLRIEQEKQRGGATLPMPEQEVEAEGEGYVTRFRPLLPAEDWNAQISLLTGMAAADLMLGATVGILRTMPDPEQKDIDTLRRQARGLGVEWPQDASYGDFLRSLDTTDGRHLFLVHEATSLFRGAGYTAFDGQEPELRTQSAIAAPYAHATAPLRRLVDRFVLEICAAICAEQEIPGWAREALQELPETMKAADSRAKSVERACVDAVEAAVLQPRVGEEFAGIVVDVDDKGGFTVQVAEPAVVARGTGEVEAGDEVRVRLVEADVTEHRITFELA